MAACIFPRIRSDSDVSFSYYTMDTSRSIKLMSRQYTFSFLPRQMVVHYMLNRRHSGSEFCFN